MSAQFAEAPPTDPFGAPGAAQPPAATASAANSEASAFILVNSTAIPYMRLHIRSDIAADASSALENCGVRIYFAGSIRGGREDASLYQRLVATLWQHGQVLTEHVAGTEAAGEPLSDREIHDRDLSWLRSADVVVAEATVSSLGVGYEIAHAVALRKPVLVLFRPSARPAARLSAMVAGAPGVKVLEYADPDELEGPLEDFFDTWRR